MGGVCIYTYRMLMINRIREYRRLISNLWIPLVSLIVVFIFIGYQLIYNVLPVIYDMKAVNEKLLITVKLLMVLFSLCTCFRNTKPLIIIKPVTLYLFTESQIKKMIRLKYVGTAIKHLFVVLFLSCSIRGILADKLFFEIAGMLFLFLEITSLLRWEIYHRHHGKGKMFALWILATGIFLLSYQIPWLIIISLGIFMVLYIHAFFLLKLDWNQFEEEMRFTENLLTAQNYNNEVLLKQFASEKKLRKVTGQKQISKLGRKYPLSWKAGTSIFRLSSIMILVGTFMFCILFAIYKLPFFWSFPLLNQKEIRYALLLFGMMAVYRLSLQSMIEQLDSIMEKAKNGLFLPMKKRDILIQFSFFPSLVVILISVVLAFLLGSGLKKLILIGGAMVILTWLILYLQLTKKNLLSKIYFLINISILILSFILT